MIKFNGLGHINIVVSDINIASSYYRNLFGAIPQQEFPHFRNIGFAKSAGFLATPEQVTASIQFLEIPGAGVFLELMEYHQPLGITQRTEKKANDINGVGHICLRVHDIDNAFAQIKNSPETRLISDETSYRPFKIDTITPDEFHFFDPALENSQEEKQRVCDIIGKIRYFYFIDKYGVQWEFEEGHSDIGA
ncbi:VOC family protein [Serratia microhaemolytica]|uniref:VOC family protein n=1 Tax=Serratia microhaemolytica TaxID=2675110 RepID=UPI000FDE7BF5|nr:VOC family protein [Serratia microhaemolytica]